MALPDFNMRQLLEAGVHFGHQSYRWNPKMGKYIFGERNGIHIIDLGQTVLLLHQALKAVSDVVATGGRVLFVGTKRQAVEPIAGAAKRCAQYHVNHRWLGGMMTNWKTISHSMRRLHNLEELLATQAQNFTKKEQLRLQRTHDKLSRVLGGIKDMGGLPDLLVIIDTNREQIAIKEARCLNIPVVAILDTNCNPDGVAYPVPGNDDAGRSIAFYCDIFARAAIDGISRFQKSSGQDIGATVEPIVDDVLGVASAIVEPSTLAAKDVFVRLSAPNGNADDLKMISSIDLELEKKMNDFGIFHYWQISVLQLSDIGMISEALSCGEAIERDGWVVQASALIGSSG